MLPSMVAERARFELANREVNPHQQHSPSEGNRRGDASLRLGETREKEHEKEEEKERLTLLAARTLHGMGYTNVSGIEGTLKLEGAEATAGAA